MDICKVNSVRYVLFSVVGFLIFGLFSFVSAETTDELFADLPTTPHVLDITIIGDKYIDMNKFRNDAEKFKTTLLGLEPFASHPRDIVFHTIENNTDLGCVYSLNENPSTRCDNELVASVVKNSGVPTDKLLVLVNGISYGFGARYAIAGNYTAEIAIHELGHIFGLFDEYPKQSDSLRVVVNGSCQANCCFSSACTDWKDIEGAMCIPGCGNSSWYRSSENSVMNDFLLGRTFNAVSQRVINQEILNYIEESKIDISMNYFKDHPFVNGSLYVGGEVTTSRASAISKIELYVDDMFFASKVYPTPIQAFEIIAPGVLKRPLVGPLWNTTLLPSGSSHTVYEKVYDVAGNIGVSEKVLLTIDNTPPIISIANPIDGASVGDMVPIKFSWSDISGVSRIELYIDNASFGYLRPPESSFIWNTTNLEPGSTHTLYAKAYDNVHQRWSPSNNVATSSIITVTIANYTEPKTSSVTTLMAQDAMPFVISNIQISNGLNPGDITVTWDTNKVATSSIEILAGLCWGEVPCHMPPAYPVNMLRHSFTFSNSAPSTTYIVRVKAQDVSGNLAFADHTFTTAYSPASEFHGPRWSAQKFYRILGRGVRGNEVKTLQEFFARSPDIYPEGLVTGYFGPLTEVAVKRFQVKYGIVSSGTAATTGYGLVGPRTRAKLNELYK